MMRPNSNMNFIDIGRSLAPLDKLGEKHSEDPHK